MFILTERHGQPRELGRARGREYRHGILRLLHEYFGLHSCHESARLLRRFAESSMEFHRATLGTLFADFQQEIEGIAEGADAPLEKVIWFNLHGWPVLWAHLETAHFLRNFPIAPGVRIELPTPCHACSSVGVIASDHGPLVAGNLDDSTLPYRLELTRPATGYAHVDLGRTAMAGSSRCLNEAGLAMGISSVWPSCEDWSKIEARGMLNFDLVVRAVIQHCGTVREAVAMMENWPTQLNLVLADAAGDLVRVEKSILGQWVTPPSAGWVASTNHYASPEAQRALAQRGLDWDRSGTPARGGFTLERYERYAELMSAREGNFTLEFIRTVIADHKFWPNGICNPMSVSTVALPREKRFLVADRAPCTSPYQEVSL